MIEGQSRGLSGAQEIEGGVMSDGEQPGTQGAAPVVGLQGSESLEEGFLRQILGVGRVADEPQQERVDGSVVAVENPGKGVPVSGQTAADEVGVGIEGFGHGN
jgi:hypothetical protein